LKFWNDHCYVIVSKALLGLNGADRNSAASHLRIQNIVHGALLRCLDSGNSLLDDGYLFKLQLQEYVRAEFKKAASFGGDQLKGGGSGGLRALLSALTGERQ